MEKGSGEHDMTETKVPAQVYLRMWWGRKKTYCSASALKSALKQSWRNTGTIYKIGYMSENSGLVWQECTDEFIGPDGKLL